MKALGIVIVNYRTPQLVIDCLRSLVNEVRAEQDCDVIVVDNASADGSVEQIQHAIQVEGWTSWAAVQPVDTNLGFAGGNNVAIRIFLAERASKEYVLLLNPDTVVRPKALRTLLEFMDQHPKVGIAGSRLEDPDGTPQCSAFRFPTVAGEFEGGMRLGLLSRALARWVVAPPVKDEPHATDWMAGASMIVRKAVFDAIGLMDADYFLYFEETDFFLHAWRAGFECWYVPDSRVVHLVGQSSGVTDTKKPRKRQPRYWFESRQRYFTKNHGWFYARAADVAWATGFSLWRLRRWLMRKPDNDPPHLLGDFMRFSFFNRD